MQARFVPVQVQDGKVEEFVAYFEGAKAAEIRGAKGNAGFYVLTEPGSTNAVLFSLWNSPEDATASQSIFQSMAAEFGKLLAAPPSPKHFDVRIGG